MTKPQASPLDGVLFANAGGVIQSWTPAAEQVLGCRAEGLSGKSITELFPVRLRPDGVAVDLLAEARRNGTHVEHGVRLRVDGSSYTAQVITSTLINASGAPDGFVVVISDATAHQERAQSMVRYTKALETSNLDLTRFASVASHDLQEPLRKILSFSDRLIQRSGANLDPGSRDYVDRIQRAA